jgi:hypothetical protein
MRRGERRKGVGEKRSGGEKPKVSSSPLFLFSSSPFLLFF